VTALALLVAGCDEDEPQQLADGADGAPAAEEDPATGTFRKSFEEVCRATDRALAHAQRQELGTPGEEAEKPSRAELQRFYEEVVVPARRAEAETLARIEPPSELQSAVDAYLAEHAAATELLAAELALIRNPGIEETALAKADAAADAAGVPRC
jgi:hypothetical protein